MYDVEPSGGADRYSIDIQGGKWSKKAQDHKDKTRKDLAAIVAKAVKKGVHKELSNIESRKRDSDSDDSSAGEVNLLEELGKFDLNDVDLDMIGTRWRWRSLKDRPKRI